MAPTTSMGPASRWVSPVDGASLAVVRMIFGVVMAFGMLRFWGRGWVDEFFVQPSFHFRYWGLAWVPVPGEVGCHVLVWGTGVAALLVAAGAFTRASLAAFVVGFTWLELLEESLYLNHYYAVSLFAVLLLCTDAAQVWSVDARRRRRRGEVPGAHIPRWQLGILQLQLGLIYFFAGVAKLQPDWLACAQPLTIWMGRSGDVPVVGPWLAHPTTAVIMSWGGCLFDLFIPLVLRSRFRLWGWLVVVGFHVVTGSLFNIGLFPLVMIGLTTVFFAPDWPRVLQRRLWSHHVVARAPLTTTPPRLLRAFLVVFFVVQVLLPLRHWAYPGPARWTMEGFRYAWKVMVMEKTAVATFHVVSVDGTRRRTTDGDGELIPLQKKTMASRPEMILEYAHHLRDLHEAQWGTPVRVTVDAFAALNGRRSQRLIDPDVDLAAIEDDLRPKTWIVPLAPQPTCR